MRPFFMHPNSGAAERVTRPSVSGDIPISSYARDRNRALARPLPPQSRQRPDRRNHGRRRRPARRRPTHRTQQGRTQHRATRRLDTTIRSPRRSPSQPRPAPTSTWWSPRYSDAGLTNPTGRRHARLAETGRVPSPRRRLGRRRQERFALADIPCGPDRSPERKCSAELLVCRGALFCVD